MRYLLPKKQSMVVPGKALPGRTMQIVMPGLHFVLGTRIAPPYPPKFEVARFAMGCFWGAERVFWELPGVHTTAVGYAGGFTENPTYEEVCSGRTGHTETVQVVFDPAVTSYGAMLSAFFERHDPTQHMRQGNDVGTQYRSAIFTASQAQEQRAAAAVTAYGERLAAASFGAIVSEVAPAGVFYFAEDYHQQYLAKNPDGYCGLGGTGVACPVGLFGGAPD